MTIGPMMGWGWLPAWMLFSAVLMIGVVFLVRTLTSGGNGSGASAHSALEVLEERFARGEIDRHEFEERKGL